VIRRPTPGRLGKTIEADALLGEVADATGKLNPLPI